MSFLGTKKTRGTIVAPRTFENTHRLLRKGPGAVIVNGRFVGGSELKNAATRLSKKRRGNRMNLYPSLLSDIGKHCSPPGKFDTRLSINTFPNCFPFADSKIRKQNGKSSYLFLLINRKLWLFCFICREISLIRNTRVEVSITAKLCSHFHCINISFFKKYNYVSHNYVPRKCNK